MIEIIKPNLLPKKTRVRHSFFASFQLLLTQPRTQQRIKTKHNSNHKTQQSTLEGEIIHEYTYYVLGFVPSNVVRLEKDVWFSKLSNEQISAIEKHLNESYCR